MKYSMRWFGPHDPVSLNDIRQAGCTTVVTALHQIPVGEIWTVEKIQERQNLIEKDNAHFIPLKWEVVESLPVHEDIKKGRHTRERYIENYTASLENLAKCGIKTVCYNFMPVLDWSRTDVNYELPDGSRTLRFDVVDFALFDLFILKRKDAHYGESIEVEARKRWEKASPSELKRIKDTVLLGLPGSGEKYELDEFARALGEYKDVGDKGLRENLYYFVQKVGPAAESLGINMCIHPDDPPRPLLGLPRVVSKAEDIHTLLEAYPSRANGLTLCTGSLGVSPENDLPAMVSSFADRIHFLHLRSTKREENPLNFKESNHLEGDIDMYRIVKAIKKEEQRRKRAGMVDAEIPMRPDHGFQMLDDLSKITYPGYSAIGRLKGLAELRGLEYAIEREIA